MRRSDLIRRPQTHWRNFCCIGKRHLRRLTFGRSGPPRCAKQRCCPSCGSSNSLGANDDICGKIMSAIFGTKATRNTSVRDGIHVDHRGRRRSSSATLSPAQTVDVAPDHGTKEVAAKKKQSRNGAPRRRSDDGADNRLPVSAHSSMSLPGDSSTLATA